MIPPTLGPFNVFIPLSDCICTTCSAKPALSAFFERTLNLYAISLLGNSRLRLRSEGAATTASEALDTASCASGRAHPVSLAMLRGRCQLEIGRHVETAHESRAIFLVRPVSSVLCYLYFISQCRDNHFKSLIES